MSESMLETFIAEARELLEEGSRALIALEREAGDAKLINTLFRSFHTMKGASALFDVVPMTRALHAAEDLLHAVREGRTELRPELADLMFATLDQVGEWLDTLASAGALDAQAEERAQTLVARAKELGREQAESAAPAAKPSILIMTEALPDWVNALSRSPELVGQALIAVEYAPDPGCFFTGDDPLRLVSLVPNLLLVRVLDGVRGRRSEADPFSCALRFRLVTSARLDELHSLFRYVAEQVKLYSFSVGFDDELDAAVRALREVTRALSEPPHPDVAGTRRQSYADFVLNALTASGLPRSLHEQFQSAQELALKAADDGLLKAAVERLLATIAEAKRIGMRLSGLPQAIRASVPPGPINVRSNSLRAPTVSLPALPPVQDLGGLLPLQPLAATPPGSEPVAAPRREGGAVTNSYKVDQARIDALVDLAGELLVSKNALPYLARRAEQMSVPGLAREIKDQASTLARIAEGFHHAVMQLRIIPLSAVFDRFPRLVRDLSRQLGKRVRLVLEGAGTEADKSTVERLVDPLVHILRNSLDHGLELPEERSRAGKPEEGLLRLAAKQERGLLVVRIEDDGRGIDPAGIRASAIRKGVIDEAEARKLSDQESLNLIFHAGFSTRDQVSDLSGRGVGMDVVRTTIEACKGTVEVHSQVGKGTEVVLLLPISMAVTRVLLVASVGQVFGIPFELVRETIHITRADVGRVRDVDVITVRGQVLPLLSLTMLLGQTRVDDHPEVVTVMVVRLSGGDVALEVDALHEAVDVMLKPLEGPLANVRGYLGASLLGDGRALLVLNLAELSERRHDEEAVYAHAP